MNKKAKIVVLHMKELIYTGLFVILGILFVVILVLMFSSKVSSAKPQFLPQILHSTNMLKRYCIPIQLL